MHKTCQYCIGQADTFTKLTIFMRVKKVNKRKIFNDPVYGFVTIPDELIFDLVESNEFQRLRRIKQLGLTHLVYPGALHTRFQHSLGAMHLMTRAISELRLKGHLISDEEVLGVCIAILLHDIGHGPYSHALEHSIVDGISHEKISSIIINQLNRRFEGRLETALSIFNNEYQKKYLSKLVSGQFDMDRLDYLKRDSYFTGVHEGTVNYERLLSMINIVNDNLVIDYKGIYSIEKFITARRLMYWQVYLHKTVLAAEYTIMNVLKRAKYLSLNGENLFATPSLAYFLKNRISYDDFCSNSEIINNFSKLDDFDIFTSMKVWVNHPDKVLSSLSNSITNRRLLKIELGNTPPDEEYVQNLTELAQSKLKIAKEDVKYFVFTGKAMNSTYIPGNDSITIHFGNNEIADLTDVSDHLNRAFLNKPVTKFFVCYPKELV